MPTFRANLVAVILAFSSSLAFGCSCSNSTPIQKSYVGYRDRAVFTAHVVQLMGRVHNWSGKRMSDQVLAVVHERYWGLPWYWPKVVVLDGGFFCNIALEEGKDYLVSGRRERYGVLGVAGCSRTQPLETAQLDMRTLDGSHCAEPGGTIIGQVYRGKDVFHQNPFASDVSLTFRGQDGKTYSAQSDRDGIFELQHLAAGTYTLDSQFGANQHFSNRGNVVVTSGVCHETSALIKDFEISGRLSPGLSRYVTVKLVNVDASEGAIPGDLRADGRFYFTDVPDGKYLLALDIALQGAKDDFYYPGTIDPRKAVPLKVANHKLMSATEFNFDTGSLPIVPIPVALDPPADSGRFSWHIRILRPRNNVVAEERWVPGKKFVLPYGLPGWSYDVQLYGYSSRPTEYGDCVSRTTPVTAKSGLSVIQVAVPAECR
jgi:hypothetical protein